MLSQVPGRPGADTVRITPHTPELWKRGVLPGARLRVSGEGTLLAGYRATRRPGPWGLSGQRAHPADEKPPPAAWHGAEPPLPTHLLDSRGPSFG